MQKELKKLNRLELMGNLKTLVKREKDLTLEILDYLQEISNRKLFLEMGYSSLFSFLTEELGYCSGTAYLRIQTMKALEFPQNRERILKDKASLNTLAKTQSFINNENKLLGKHSEPLLTKEEKEEFFAVTEGVAASKVEEVLKEKKHEMVVKKSTEQGLPPPVKKIFKKFNFEADQDLVGLIEEIKNLLPHTCPGGELADVLKKALPLAIQEIKIKKGLIKRSEIKIAETKEINEDLEVKNGSSMKSQDVEEPNNQKSLISPLIQKDLFCQLAQRAPASILSQKDQICQSTHVDLEVQMRSESTNKYGDAKRRITRAIPTKIRRKIWSRDGGCCQYKDPKTGKQCGAKHKLELDHVKPWSMGGDHSLENLWILCRNHNVYRWNSNIAK